MNLARCPEPALESGSDLLNLLEPRELIRAFLDRPPAGFETLCREADGKPLYGFLAPLDLFSVADPGVERLGRRLRKLLPSLADRLFTPRVLFLGTTVSEYAPLPAVGDPQRIVDEALNALRRRGRQLLVVKDIPWRSPLLSAEENDFAAALIERLRRRGFFILYGQRLGFVPVDSRSTEEHLARFSRSRRKDIRRKLRSFSRITVEEVKTGDDFFTAANVELLYGLYRNVYEQSEIHFDLLTPEFFGAAFRDRDGGGIVFLYRARGKIVGFNLCFPTRDALVDKYVGFLYPDSRELNLYFLSWFYNLEYCRKRGLKTLITGWTDPEIKSYLGADFTFTRHAVYVKNPVLRFLLRPLRIFFEPERRAAENGGGR